MKQAALYILTVLFGVLCLSCSEMLTYDELTDEGVSLELARFRKKNYEQVRYNLFFSIPESKQEAVGGEVEISLLLRKSQPVIIDFKADENQLLYVKVNDKSVPYLLKDEHIIIDPNQVKPGKNRVSIAFTAGDQSLNRRENTLYTLLVPDRARTVFPCFDQPDIKALFTLELEVPTHWEAVSNGVSSSEPVINNSRKNILFSETEPLSTYLFSFVTGELEELPFEKDGRIISIYHRETDTAKVAQCPEIARQVFVALEWMENYTGIPYPFAKYDLVILPGFQYGGMEHTGATLYNDRRMFLSEQPTLNEELSRSSLIAHETAHMWFGDYVTMKWFDDVWTKEVFANYFAAKIVEPLYPDMNHALNFMVSYFPPAYSEDRTAGSNPVKQPLDNLRNAGLVYGNIIYNKSPIVLDMLVRKIGEESFRKGLQEYLQTYAYGNAAWEDLIELLDQYTEEDLKTWSHHWINEKGMPTISQEDSLSRSQDIRYTMVNNIPIPNTDGKAYGFFRLDEQQLDTSFALLDTCSDEVLRGSVLLNLYENVLNNTLASERYLTEILDYVQKEENPLLFSLALGQVGNCLRLFPFDISRAENSLWTFILSEQPSLYRLQALRLYSSIAESSEAVGNLYSIWKDQLPPEDCILSENDYMNLSYVLAVRLPEQAKAIAEEQLSRISNPDRRHEYQFISPAVSPEKTRRDSVFTSLLIAENRRIEPWASSALSWLNHPSRQQEAIAYIRPSLDILEEVQRTGDIFFPTNWLKALLAGHRSQEAKEEVEQFFMDHPDYPRMLSNKIKQQADFLYRANAQ